MLVLWQKCYEILKQKEKKRGIQEVFFSFDVREKNNIDSPLLISGITENENNKEKERKHWIPNQVGDDIECAFGDDIGVVFGDDSGDVIPAKAGIQDYKNLDPQSSWG